jgi:hypothetical protein
MRAISELRVASRGLWSKSSTGNHTTCSSNDPKLVRPSTLAAHQEVLGLWVVPKVAIYAGSMRFCREIGLGRWSYLDPNIHDTLKPRRGTRHYFQKLVHAIFLRSILPTFSTKILTAVFVCLCLLLYHAASGPTSFSWRNEEN